MAPSFEVDPFWPKPLPNHWVLGSTIGVSVDAQDHVWIIHRPGSVEDNFKAADLNADRSARAATSRRRCSSSIRRATSWSLGRPGPGLRVAGQQPRHHGRSQGQRLDRRQRRQRHADPEVHEGRESSCSRSASTACTTAATTPRTSGAPAKIFVDPAANEIYVADGYGNRRVIVFDADTGKYKRHWGAYGSKPDDDQAAGATTRRRRRRSSSTPCTARTSRRTASSTSATASTIASRCSARTARS